MTGKFLLAVIVAALVAFLGGWLLFGVLFSDYYSSNTKEVARVIIKTQPQMWAISIANIAWVILLTCILNRSGNTSFVKGFMNSLWISLLIMSIINFSVYGFWDIYPLGFILIDIIISTIFWGIVGGVAGAILGSGKNKINHLK